MRARVVKGERKVKGFLRIVFETDGDVPPEVVRTCASRVRRMGGVKRAYIRDSEVHVRANKITKKLRNAIYCTARRIAENFANAKKKRRSTRRNGHERPLLRLTTGHNGRDRTPSLST
jgi:hypothetical protein